MKSNTRLQCQVVLETNCSVLHRKHTRLSGNVCIRFFFLCYCCFVHETIVRVDAFITAKKGEQVHMKKSQMSTYLWPFNRNTPVFIRTTESDEAEVVVIKSMA